MSKFIKKLATLTTVTVLLSGLSFSLPTFAAESQEANTKAEERKKQRKTQILGERTGKKVQKAYEFYSNDQTEEALNILLDIKPSKEFDRAYVNRMIGSLIAADDTKTDDAIGYLKKATEPDILNFNEQEQTLKLLADLYMQSKQYKLAIKGYLSWMDFSGKHESNTYIRIANAYYELKQLDKIIAPADTAISLLKKPSADPYVLKLASYYERKQYKNAIKVVETLVKTFPQEKRWWAQLGMFYMLVEDYERALSAMELAYKQGYLEKESEIKTLSQLYATNSLPWRAAETLAKYVKSGLVKDNKNNLSSIANSYLAAQNIEDAAKYFGLAAAKDNDAELYRKQGALLLQAEEYKGAVVALKNAIDNGIKNKGRTHMSLAQAYFYQRKFKQAYVAINESAKDKKTKRSATSWKAYIKEAANRNGITL